MCDSINCEAVVPGQLKAVITGELVLRLIPVSIRSFRDSCD